MVSDDPIVTILLLAYRRGLALAQAKTDSAATSSSQRAQDNPTNNLVTENGPTIEIQHRSVVDTR